jgi:cytochrome c-type biogenesis protein CcsB
MKNTLNKIFSMPLMVLVLFGFFAAIGIATFVENDFGTPIAQKWVYQSNWFGLIIVYLFFSLIYNLIKFNLFQLKKMSSLLFHFAFLIIIIGAVITRYAGFEGVMPIREGESSNQIISSETYLQIKVHDNELQYTDEIPLIIDTNSVAYVEPGIRGGNPLSWLGNLFFDHNNYFETEFAFGDNRDIKIECLEIIKNPKDTLIPTADGPAFVEIVTGGMEGRTYTYIETGTVHQMTSGLKIAFNNNTYTDAIQIIETDSGIVVSSPYDLMYLQMSDQSQGTVVRDSIQEFRTKRLYMIGGDQFAFNNYYLGGRLETISSTEKTGGMIGVKVNVELTTKSDTYSQEVVLKGGKGIPPKLEYFGLQDLFFELSYGSKIIDVPFSIQLRDFQLERYPGTMNPSSFASEVTLIDAENNLEEEHRIFMNSVLDYGGYRFFQSSYDPDEGGTILSVNHDAPGTLMTYIGYTLLFIGFFINLFSRHSRFRMLMKKTKKIRIKREALMILLMIGFGSQSIAQNAPIVDEVHAEKFAKLIVQDQGGRFKPVHTLANDILKKVSRRTEYEGMNAMQVFIGIHTSPDWFQEPIIYVSGKPLREEFNLDGKYAALSDFLNVSPTSIQYLLDSAAQVARIKRPAERNEYDKDVLKTDERINVFMGVFNGSYLKIFPYPNDPNNAWYSPYDVQSPFEGEDSLFVSAVTKLYFNGVATGHETGNWKAANQTLDIISEYQKKSGNPELMPSESTIGLEIWYNEANIFKKLMSYYFVLGLLLLILQLFQIFAVSIRLKWPIRIGVWLFAALFVYHGFGLGVRWYLSGHAPWSNGYEAVVFIAFITVLAGLLFYKKSRVVIGATGILAALMLFVAHMNQMDPEITNLVPVLKSYWLMIHVAIITGSYGFLGLGAMLGLIILILNLFLSKENKKKMSMLTKELTYVSEMVITIGLFMLTIGTFLGGVWANESWGRYWGWDAKETWALASVLIYAVILHLRFVPFMKSQFTFNALSLWGYGSIIMTFFGVNYYLSGLHSYAQGDSIPIPSWVPITISSLAVLTIASYFVVKKVNKKSSDLEKEV